MPRWKRFWAVLLGTAQSTEFSQACPARALAAPHVKATPSKPQPPQSRSLLQTVPPGALPRGPPWHSPRAQ